MCTWNRIKFHTVRYNGHERSINGMCYLQKCSPEQSAAAAVDVDVDADIQQTSPAFLSLGG